MFLPQYTSLDTARTPAFPPPQVREADRMEKKKTKPIANQLQVLHALAVLKRLSQGKNVERMSEGS